MNKKRRKNLERVVNMLEEAKGMLDTALEEEQEYRDNMPENMEGGDKAYAAEEAINALEDVVNNLEEALTGLDSIE